MTARAAAWGRRRPLPAAALLYLLLAFGLFGPGLLPGKTLSASDIVWSSVPWEAGRPAHIPGYGSNGEQADAATQFHPPLQVIRATLPDIPLWDPSQLGGRPLVADPQAGIFSPFSLPAYVLPFWTSLAVMAALKLWVAALGAFALGRVAQMRFAGALMAGLVFGFSLWAVTWTSWTTMSVWAFLPWICVFAELCLRRPGALPVAGLGAAVGLQFLGGHPSSSFQVLAAVGAFFLVRTLADPALRRRLPLRLVATGLALVLGAALAAVLLVPFLELLARSNDLEARRGASELFHQNPRYLLGLFLPRYWGFGPTSQVFGGVMAERAYYVAALPLMLGTAALVLRPQLVRLGVAAFSLALLAVATGLPPFYDVVVALPLFGASNNGRLAVVAVLGLAVLAGWGLDELTAKGLPRRRAWVVGLAVVLLGIPLAIAQGEVGRDALGPALEVAWGFATPTEELVGSTPGGLGGVLRLASVLEWLVLAGVALLFLVLRVRGRLGPTVFATLALALVAADLVKAGGDYNPVIPREDAAPPATPALRFLQARDAERFVGLRPKTLSLVVPLAPNLAMREGLQDMRGYVLPSEERVFTLWQERIAASRDCYYFFCTIVPGDTPESRRVLGRLGVGLLLQHPQDPRLRDARLLYEGPDARVYANPDAVPRAFLVDGQVPARDEATARAILASPNFPARRAVVTEEPLPGLDAPGLRPPGRAAIADYGREQVQVDTDARRPALLVLTDAFYPGWKAEVDGRPAEIHRVNYLHRGVSVPPGRHQVEFSYAPASWRAGWIISLLALLALLALVVVGLRRRRREARRP